MWLTLAAAFAASPEYEECQQKAQMTRDLVLCDEEETERQKLRMRAAYESLLSSIQEPERKALLERAQSAWMTYREALCTDAGFLEGQLPALIDQGRASCLLEEVTARATALEGRLPLEKSPAADVCDKGPAAAKQGCLEGALASEDKRLNSVYGQVMSSEKPQSEKDTLRAAQRLWIPYRDATCAYEGKSAAGQAIRCKIRLTGERAGEIAKQIPR